MYKNMNKNNKKANTTCTKTTKYPGEKNYSDTMQSPDFFITSEV